MWVDPDEDLTFDELLRKAWSGMSPRKQKSILAIAARKGMTRDDALLYLLQLGVDMDKDPALHPQYESELEFHKYPLGRDPRLNTV